MESSLDSPAQESGLSTRGSIIRWWETRRSHFNGVVLAVGFASWLLVMLAGSAAVKPGVDFEEPFAMLFGSAIYIAIANVCYTLGWVVDTVFYHGRPRTHLFKSGMIFAAVLTALPGVWAVLLWLITLHTGHKLD